MSRSILISFLAAVTLFNSAAYADVIYDLPNLEEGVTPPQPPPPPAPVERPQESRVGRVTIKQISRKTEGAVYRIDLRKALPLTNIDIKVLKGNVKIREASLVTAKGERIAIREFKNVQVVPAGSKLYSENLNLTTPVAAIEIRAESYLETADLEVEATSDVQAPVLRLKVEAPKPPAPPKNQEPAESVPSRVSPIRAGDRVLYTSGGSTRFAQVLETFQSGDIRIQFDDYSSANIVSVSTLSKGVNCVAGATSTICRDDRVLYQSGGSSRRGSVKEVYSTGKVRLLFEDYTSLSTVDVSTLSKTGKCMEGYCKGAKVLYVAGSSQRPATVSETFRNGAIFVRFQDYSSDSMVTASALTSVTNSIDGLVSGSRVLYAAGGSTRPAVVQQIYRNGLIEILFEGYSNNSFVSSSALSNATNCMKSICINNKVLYSSGSSSRTAVVTQIYISGVVAIILEGYTNPSYVNVSTLFKEVNCVKSRGGSICKGNRVIFSDGYSKKAATVAAVFSPEKVSVRFDGYSSNSFVSVSTLSK